jgi:hypothetical protein
MPTQERSEHHGGQSAPVLTLHQRERACEFVEHPVDVARRACLDAAEFMERTEVYSGTEWAAICRDFAAALPRGSRLVRGGA